MREVGEDGFPSIFPQRVGNTDVGVAQERVMHAAAGGYGGIRTIEHENTDGTVTTLRTRSGWPVFETTEASGGPPDTADIKGLVTDGTLENNTVLFDGKDIIKDSRAFPGGSTFGDTYQVNDFTLNGEVHSNALVSGANHWFSGENLGSKSWVYVPEFEAECWKVTLSVALDNLSSFTITFEAMPTTSAIPPARTIAQTITVSIASPISDSDEAFPTHCAADIEDICPNGNRIIVVNACAPAILNYLLTPAQIGLYCIGRNVFGAVEITISGTPPFASAEAAVVLTNVQARGAYFYSQETEYDYDTSDYGDKYVRPGSYGSVQTTRQEWTNIVCGLRYEFDNDDVYINTISSDARIYRVGTASTTRRTTEELIYVDPSGHYETHKFDDPGSLVITSNSHIVTVSMEGVSSTANTPTASTIQPKRFPANYWYVNVPVGGDPWDNSSPFHSETPQQYTDSGEAGTCQAQSMYFGNATYPAKSGGLSTTSCLPLTETVQSIGHNPAGGRISISHVTDISTGKVVSRPMWNSSGGRGVIGSTGYSSTDFTVQTTGATTGGGCIIPVKYANRVFGLQAIANGSQFDGTITRGIGIAHPACIGKADAGLQNILYSTTAENRLGNKLNNHTESIYHRSWALNQSTLPVKGTSRYLQPKAVVDLKNVVYAHYF